MNFLWKRLLFIAILSSVFAIAFNGKRAKRESNWLACYQESSNRLHFQKLGKTRYQNGNCVGRAQLPGPRGYQLITNENDKGGFGESRAGTKRSIRLRSGRLISVSQWEKKGAPNRLIVAEPNPTSGRVAKHCVLENHEDIYSTKYNSRRGRLEVRVAQKGRRGLQHTWKACKL